jgi:hypothetical protein
VSQEGCQNLLDQKKVFLVLCLVGGLLLSNQLRFDSKAVLVIILHTYMIEELVQVRSCYLAFIGGFTWGRESITAIIIYQSD